MQLLKQLSRWGVYALVIYMPFHIFLSQWLSTLSGGLSIWKAAKDVVTIMLLFAVLLLAIVRRQQFGRRYWLWWGLAVAYGLLHVFMYIAERHTTLGVAVLATVYNNRLIWYLLIGLTVGSLAWHDSYDTRRLIKVLLVVSSLVCLFGILQYLLPKDLMTHFGYSIARGVKPNFFIDDKPNLPRIMSTLRDPNSLGAYLLVPWLLLAALWFRTTRRRKLIAGLFSLHLAALCLTFSRSAWIAALVSLGVFLFISYRRQTAAFLANHKLLLVAAVVVLLAGAVSFRHQYAVQNILVHSDKSTKLADSNKLHFRFAEEAAQGIEHQPLGHGPGTAGLVSIQTKHVVLTENYYLQLAYEVGLEGLALFVLMQVLIYRQLLRSALNSPLRVVLLATFWGYIITNLLLHIWSNEAVALQWWLLAGLVVGMSGRVESHRQPEVVTSRSPAK